MKWTDEQIEQLRRLWNHGKSDAEIADIMNISRQQVNNKRKHLGWQAHKENARLKNDIGDGPYRDFSRTTDMLIVQFLSEGYSLTQVAMELARDYKTLKQYCDKHANRLKAAHDMMMNHDGIYSRRIQRGKEAIV
jgi:hypothetical protein